MNTFEMFEIFREVKADYGLPDGMTVLHPDTRYPRVSIIYGEADELPDLAWQTDRYSSTRVARIYQDGLNVEVQAPPIPLWGKARDVFAAPSPNDPPKTYTYPEGDAA
jgi:hypothetical protein